MGHPKTSRDIAAFFVVTGSDGSWPDAVLDCWIMEVPLTNEQEKLLEEVAARSQKTKTVLAAEAIEAYLSHERWFHEQIEQSRAAACCSELLDHDEVVRRMEQRFRRP